MGITIVSSEGEPLQMVGGIPLEDFDLISAMTRVELETLLIGSTPPPTNPSALNTTEDRAV